MPIPYPQKNLRYLTPGYRRLVDWTVDSITTVVGPQVIGDRLSSHERAWKRQGYVSDPAYCMYKSLL